MKLKRVYHPHNKWEEVAYNMYGNTPADSIKNDLIQDVIQYFRQPSLVRENMNFVIDNFVNSCEHNFTNPSMNKVAWLGQASVAAYRSIPREIVMIAWNYLDLWVQDEANWTAMDCIREWEKRYAEKIS